MKTKENRIDLIRLKSMLFLSHIFLFFQGFVSAFGTKKNSPEFRGCFVFETAHLCPPYWNLKVGYFNRNHSTVTDLAKLRGWSTLQPRITAM